MLSVSALTTVTSPCRNTSSAVLSDSIGEIGSNHNTSVVDLTGNRPEDRKSLDRFQDETINVSSFETDSTLGSL